MAAAAAGPAEVLGDLRRARRRQRLARFDVGEAFYRAYVTGILCAVAVWLLSGVVGDVRLHGPGLARVRADGAQVVGAAVAAMAAVALRSGGRGGPLVLEAADVRHVLMAPLDRAVALRAPALRQLRFAAAAGAGAGLVGGLLAWRRLPGPLLGWLAAGALVGVSAVVGALGLAMLTSGRRAGRGLAGLAALGVLAWSGADLGTGATTSPATWLGEVALWPLRWRPLGLAGVAVAAVAVVAGLLAVGGASLEAVERRAALVGQLRFAATLQDLRTVVVLRRQLAQELPRRRPWLRLPAALAPARWPAWRRGWQGVARFPAGRLGRMALCGVVAGAAGVGVAAGTTPLALVLGLALYVAALDAVEPLAQELDHPDRRDGLPVEAALLSLRLLAPAVVVELAVAAIGVGAATAVAAAGGGRAGTAAAVGAVAAVPAAFVATAGAAVSVLQGAAAPGGPLGAGGAAAALPPEAVGLTSLLRLVLPPALAVVAAVPAIAAHHATATTGPVAAAAGTVAPVLLVVGAVGAWVRWRDRARAWWAAAQAEVRQGGPARPPAGR